MDDRVDGRVDGRAEDTRGAAPERCATVTADPEAGAVVVSVSGEIDMLTEPRLRRALREGLEQAAEGTLVVDLTDVSFFSSTGIAALVEIHTLARATGVYLVVQPNSPPDRSLTAMGLDTRWAVHHTRASALRHAAQT